MIVWRFWAGGYNSSIHFKLQCDLSELLRVNKTLPTLTDVKNKDFLRLFICALDSVLIFKWQQNIAASCSALTIYLNKQVVLSPKKIPKTWSSLITIFPLEQSSANILKIIITNSSLNLKKKGTLKPIT